MQVKPPVLVIGNPIRPLCVSLPAKRRDRDGLRFASRKQRRAVHPREQPALARDRAHRLRITPVLPPVTKANRIPNRLAFDLAARQTHVRGLVWVWVGFVG